MSKVQSTYEGWTKTAKREYTHKSGVKVVQDCNTRLWQICGGCKEDGMWYGRLWAAMQNAVGTPWTLA